MKEGPGGIKPPGPSVFARGRDQRGSSAPTSSWVFVRTQTSASTCAMCRWIATARCSVGAIRSRFQLAIFRVNPRSSWPSGVLWRKRLLHPHIPRCGSSSGSDAGKTQDCDRLLQEPFPATPEIAPRLLIDPIGITVVELTMVLVVAGSKGASRNCTPLGHGDIDTTWLYVDWTGWE